MARRHVVVMCMVATASVVLCGYALTLVWSFYKPRRLVRLVEADNVAKVKKLLAAGMDPNSRTRSGETLLHVAANSASDEVVELLMKSGADTNLRDANGDPPLNAAVTRGVYSTVKIMLDLGADMESRGMGDMTPLSAACLAQQEDICELLLQRGVSVNAQAKGGMTALHWAAWSGNPSIIRLLLKNGADANRAAVGVNSQTPLHYAVNLNHGEAAMALVEAGADPFARNDFGHTPAGLAGNMAKKRALLKVEDLIVKFAEKYSTGTVRPNAPGL